MVVLNIGIALALQVSLIHGMSLPPNITVQQLYDAWSHLAVKNMQLEMSLKSLQGNYSKLTSKLEQCQSIAAKCTFPATCKFWRDAGFTTDGKYIIDPDGPGGVDRFEVGCVMNSHYNVPMTVMHHNSEARMIAGPTKILTAYGNVRNVVYKASIQQIVAAMQVSTNCEQFIKFECYDTAITGGCTWYSRDGTPMYYWGGAAPGSKKCACGMSNTCDKPGTACNCDAHDTTWRSDSGILTDTSTLPVTKMAFGDLDDEPGFHTLGPLRCFG